MSDTETKEVNKAELPEEPKATGYKVSKIAIFPSRTISLGDFNSVKLSASIEIVFDTPVPTYSKELKDAFTVCRHIVREEFKQQYKPYVKVKKRGGVKK